MNVLQLADTITVYRSNDGTDTEDQDHPQAVSRVRFRLPALTMETIVGPMGESLAVDYRDNTSDEADTYGDTACSTNAPTNEDIGHSESGDALVADTTV
ncbi:hypothetical protein EIP86_007549 [Pleurotus ostreatoroseus]|nr:hypothetical protein EIP86_007549 [Pleurotus ostreatoroseus]